MEEVKRGRGRPRKDPNAPVVKKEKVIKIKKEKVIKVKKERMGRPKGSRNSTTSEDSAYYIAPSSDADFKVFMESIPDGWERTNHGGLIKRVMIDFKISQPGNISNHLFRFKNLIILGIVRTSEIGDTEYFWYIIDKDTKTIKETLNGERKFMESTEYSPKNICNETHIKKYLGVMIIKRN